MNSRKNSNKKFMFFHITKSLSETKLSSFETQLIKQCSGGVRIATTCLRVSQSLGNVLFASFYHKRSQTLQIFSVKLSKCTKAYQRCGRPSKQLKYIFGINQLNIRRTICNFCVTVGIFFRTKTCSRTHVSWS